MQFHVRWSWWMACSMLQRSKLSPVALLCQGVADVSIYERLKDPIVSEWKRVCGTPCTWGRKKRSRVCRRRLSPSIYRETTNNTHTDNNDEEEMATMSGFNHRLELNKLCEYIKWTCKRVKVMSESTLLTDCRTWLKVCDARSGKTCHFQEELLCSCLSGSSKQSPRNGRLLHLALDLLSKCDSRNCVLAMIAKHTHSIAKRRLNHEHFLIVKSGRRLLGGVLHDVRYFINARTLRSRGRTKWRLISWADSGVKTNAFYIDDPIYQCIYDKR